MFNIIFHLTIVLLITSFTHLVICSTNRFFRSDQASVIFVGWKNSSSLLLDHAIVSGWCKMIAQHYLQILILVLWKPQLIISKAISRQSLNLYKILQCSEFITLVILLCLYWGIFATDYSLFSNHFGHLGVISMTFFFMNGV